MLLTIVCCNLFFMFLDTLKPLYRLAIVLNIIEEKVPLEEEEKVKGFSNSSDDDLTEKDVTIGSKEMGRYGPELKEDKIEYLDPKEEEKKKQKELERKQMKLKESKKEEEPLISNFIKKIPLAKTKDPKNMTATMGRNDPANLAFTPVQLGNQTMGALQKPMLTLERVESMQTPVPLFDPSATFERAEESKSEEAVTPKEGKLMTPGLNEGLGFNAAEFEKAIKDAKETKDYNFLQYKK